MTVRLRAGGASDVGQLRTINQDSMYLGPGVWVVADGMGGHQGGEVASATAIGVFDGTFGDRTTVSQLIASVQDANEAVYQRSASDPELSGMGTTLVAVAVAIEDGEARLAVVNVGDSRAYRLTGGQLEQISDDHSLVGEMVRDGRITPAQAREHPQKNIVTRAVGIERDVEVDEFQLLPHTGDRYLLCSDGLTDEVTEDDIAEVLRTVDDPDRAAEELVRRANDHGGRDNITVVIVDVVDDGGVSVAASAAVPDSDDFSHDPGVDTQSLMAVPDDRAHEQNAEAPRRRGRRGRRGAHERADREEATVDDGPTAPKPRLITVRSVVFVLLVLGVVGGGLFLVRDYARNTYHLAVDDGEVVIFQGRPGGFLFFDEELAERTGIDLDDVPVEYQDDVEEERAFSDLASARRFVGNVEDRIDQLDPPTSTTTTTTGSTSTLPADASTPSTGLPAD